MLPRIGPVQEVIDVLTTLGQDAKVAVASGGLTEIVRDTLHFLACPWARRETIKYPCRLGPGDTWQAGPEALFASGGNARRRAETLPRFRGRRARFRRRQGRRHGLHRCASVSREFVGSGEVLIVRRDKGPVSYAPWN